MISSDEEEGNGSDDLPNVKYLRMSANSSHDQCKLGRDVYCKCPVSHYKRPPRAMVIKRNIKRSYFPFMFSLPFPFT